MVLISQEIKAICDRALFYTLNETDEQKIFQAPACYTTLKAAVILAAKDSWFSHDPHSAIDYVMKNADHEDVNVSTFYCLCCMKNNILTWDYIKKNWGNKSEIIFNKMLDLPNVGHDEYSIDFNVPSRVKRYQAYREPYRKENYRNVFSQYDGTLNKKNICKAVAFGDLMFDKIKEYYRNNECTQSELFVMIERMQLQHLIQISSVSKTLFAAARDSNFGVGKNVSIVLKDIEYPFTDPLNTIKAKRVSWCPCNNLAYFKMLLDNKFDVTDYMVHDFLTYTGYGLIFPNMSASYKTRHDSNVHNANKRIKDIIMNCILSGWKLTYDVYKTLASKGVFIENPETYGVELKDDITEVFVGKNIPSDLKGKFKYTDKALYTYFKTQKSIPQTQKFMKENLLEYNSSCLAGLVCICTGAHKNHIKYMVEEKKVEVTPEVLENFVHMNMATNTRTIGGYLLDNLMKNYKFVRKTESDENKDEDKEDSD